ncbi:MAG: tetratricopeptide repeat protein, partial [Thermodesulfobacteriota bacterium]
MKWIFRVLLLSVVYSILWNGGQIYSSEGSGQSEKGTSTNTYTGPPEIRRYWIRRKDLINRGKTLIGKRELEAIHRVQLDLGIRNLPIFATLLIREGLKASERGSFEEAVVLCSAAKMVAPGLPYGYFALAKVYWSRSKLRIDRVLAEYLRGFFAFMENFKLTFIKFTDLFFLIGQSILLAFLLFSCILFLKYFPSLIEGLTRNFKAQVFQIMLAVLKIVGILLPFFLRLNLTWAFMYWSLLCWVSLEKRERIMLCVFLIMVIYIPWTMDTYSNFLDHSANAALNMYKANEETWNKGIKEDLIRDLEATPEDTRILFTLGLINKREGNYPKAESYFKRVISNDSSAAEAMTNLANVYLAMGNVDQAIELNSKAIDLKPRKASFHFNRYRAISKKSATLVKTDPSIERATELNPQLIQHYLKIETGNMNRFVIDETLSALNLWKGVMYHFMDKWMNLGRLVSVWVMPLTERWRFISPLLFLCMVVFFSILAQRKGSMRKCPLCGSPSRRVYPRRVEGDLICMGCYRLFVKKEGLNPKVKVKKMTEVRGYRKREELISRILSLFSLGGGHVWRNYTIRGVVFLFVFSVFILRIVYWHGLIRNSEVIPTSSPLSSAAFLIGLFACFYFISLRSISRFERQKQ